MHQPTRTSVGLKYRDLYLSDMYGWPVPGCTYAKWLRDEGWIDLSGTVSYQVEANQQVLYKRINATGRQGATHERLVCVQESTDASGSWAARTYLVYVVNEW